ncbi:MAG: AI-2E family transporter [Oscillospiraceae bacterium]
MKLEWKTCFKVGVSLFLLFIAVTYWKNVAALLSAVIGAAAPLLLGCVVAYVINIPMSFYERHYFPKKKGKFFAVSRRPVCLIGAFLTVLAVAALVIGLVIPQLADCFSLIAAEFPGMFKKFLEYAQQLDFMPEKIIASLSEIDLKSQMSSIIEKLTSGIGNVVGSVVSVVASVFSGVVTALVSIIFAVYLLMAKDTLGAQWKRIMKRYASEKLNNKFRYIVSVLNDCFHRYIVGQCTEAVILGALCTVGMLIFGFPYALMIGALTAFTALIPIAGAYIGAGVGAFMILTESPIKALLFLVFIVVLQQIEGNLIYPKVVGTSIGLPGIWVLAAVTVGGGIFGILGMMLGVPVAAAVYRIVRDDVNKVNTQSSKKDTAVKKTDVSADNTVKKLPGGNKKKS